MQHTPTGGGARSLRMLCNTSKPHRSPHLTRPCVFETQYPMDFVPSEVAGKGQPEQGRVTTPTLPLSGYLPALDECAPPDSRATGGNHGARKNPISDDSR